MRQPTITITRENQDLLKTFPRPQNANGRGVHFGLDLREVALYRKTPQVIVPCGVVMPAHATPDQLASAQAWNSDLSAGYKARFRSFLLTGLECTIQILVTAQVSLRGAVFATKQSPDSNSGFAMLGIASQKPLAMTAGAE